MRPPHPLLIRTALSIQEQYSVYAHRPQLFDLPHAAWQNCVQTVRLLEYARRRRWSASAQELAFRTHAACSAVTHELERIGELLKPRELPRVPSLRDLYSELVALYDEYDQVRIDRKGSVLAVTTEPIALDGIDLGPFKISLRYSQLPGPRCYSVVAREPNASSSDGYVHPHVLNDQLCEGEGRLPIQRALAEGRLCDFFEIVTRVLETYNAESAYLQMEDWYGVTCSSCGDSTSLDDAYGCSRCGCTLCFDCYERCNRCDETYCSGCVTACPECETVYCRSCLKSCSQCQGDCCDHCRDDDERCRDCRTADTEEAAAVHTTRSAGAAEATATETAAEAEPLCEAAAAVLAGCLGQVALPA